MILLVLLTSLLLQAERRFDFERAHPWYAAKVESHHASEKDVCMSYTLADNRNARLEVISFKTASGYSLPTVQILTDTYDPFLYGKMTFDGQRPIYELTLSTYAKEDPNIQSLLVKFADRERIIEALQSKRKATLRIYKSGGRLVREVVFSLRNSESVMTSQFAECR